MIALIGIFCAVDVLLLRFVVLQLKALLVTIGGADFELVGSLGLRGILVEDAEHLLQLGQGLLILGIGLMEHLASLGQPVLTLLTGLPSV